MAGDDPFGEWKYYQYNPSMAAAIIFVVLFGAISGLHLYQMVRTKVWIFIPFVLGGFFEFIGYCARAASANQSPDWTLMPYIIQTLFLLVAPALYAASIYMMLGRIILLTEGERHSLIPLRWLTKIFVIGDVISFMMQGGGGGIMAGAKSNPKNMQTGENVIVGGLVVQLLFFGFFVVVGALFHVKMVRNPTTRVIAGDLPWERQLYVLYATSALILIRSLFRLIEYIQGNHGYLISHEVFLYIFDSVLMWATMVIFAWIHPSEITARLGKGNGKAVRKGYEVYNLA
ncbi:RTA1 like protein-domain-containing protein [Dendryphion nanum]|uniref:RTA1 like protein-domain-containing protein n=1 Tax=Dendryphion nanum TaxID=256645 RepID=A0A9P9DXQ8_9PLEO|nr:RTA1 like protein-domain-containing protein [Dendryphion nanum]